MYSSRIQRSHRCCAVCAASVKTAFYKAAAFLLVLVCMAGLYPLAARAEYNAETPRDTVRVGFLNGNLCNDDFDTLSKEKGFTYTPVYFDLVADMEKALCVGWGGAGGRACIQLHAGCPE